MKKLLILLVCMTMVSCSSIRDRELINAYENYHRQVETLLDSVAKWDNCFMDTYGESDTYYEYWESRRAIEELNK